MADESREERQLNNELKKLVKRANQRILEMEKRTNQKGSFATKQLYDYLGSKPIRCNI